MKRFRRYLFNMLIVVSLIINSRAQMASFVSLLVCLPLMSCGSYFPPGPTAQSVKPKDLVGKWYYSPLLDHNAKVILDLIPSAMRAGEVHYWAEST